MRLGGDNNPKGFIYKPFGSLLSYQIFGRVRSLADAEAMVKLVFTLMMLVAVVSVSTHDQKSCTTTACYCDKVLKKLNHDLKDLEPPQGASGRRRSGSQQGGSSGVNPKKTIKDCLGGVIPASLDTLTLNDTQKTCLNDALTALTIVDASGNLNTTALTNLMMGEARHEGVTASTFKTWVNDTVASCANDAQTGQSYEKFLNFITCLKNKCATAPA
ncbi:uncharacterized protein LOC135210500 [Macrobrachium nipponense]|uniref:uncharacterized protein LOC135210500 n=1 Tax=Macrobrachium nipponense TaxID=159736 RepID=UPI0030C8305E